jgi:hypothetical protein
VEAFASEGEEVLKRQRVQCFIQSLRSAGQSGFLQLHEALSFFCSGGGGVDKAPIFGTFLPNVSLPYK